MKRRLVLAALVSATLAVSSAAGALQEMPVLTTGAGEWGPAGAEAILTWNENTRGSPRRFNAYVRRDGESRIRLNTGKWHGATGDIDGDFVIYQQYSPRRGLSDLWLFDLVAGTRTRLPAVVNTRRWEYWPSISGDWVLFGRVASNGSRTVVLHNLATDAHRVLASVGSRGFLEPGQVAGNFAVWTKCGQICHVYRHTISTGQTLRVNTAGRHEYAPSVDEDGVMYFASRGPLCSDRAVVKRRGADGISIIARISRGRNIDRTNVYTDADGKNHVLYDRFRLTRRCRTPATASDVFQVIDDPGTSSVSGLVEAPSSGGAPYRPVSLAPPSADPDIRWEERD